MKKIRILSAVLAILLAFSAIGLPVFGADIENYPSTDDWESQQLKVNEMTCMYEDSNWRMYIDQKSAEFALQNKKTGEYTFSNPYDIDLLSTALASDDAEDADPIRQALLSQIILTYEDIETGVTYTMKSFTDAILAGGQVSYTTLSNGIRVEYAIGTLETKRLFPIWVDKQRFEDQILSVFEARKSEMTSVERTLLNGINTQATYKLVNSAPAGSTYDPQAVANPNDPTTFEYLVNNTDKQMYVLVTNSARTKKTLESMIRKYCPEYTFDKLEEDHEITGYEGNEKEPPLFRMALEYTVDEKGLTATIPAKSIRFNETNYRLNTIALLPYFGCTATGKTTGEVGDDAGAYSRNDGYIFIPDGSGTLLNYYNEDGSLKVGILGGSMYGNDYALETIDATQANAKTYRVPVFGLVEEYSVTKVVQGNTIGTIGGETAPSHNDVRNGKRGFFAIIEEGDSFATVRANLKQAGWAGASGDIVYSTVFSIFNIKRTDSVNVGSSIGGTDSAMTTTDDTKYIGNYAIRYFLLSDPDVNAAQSGDDDVSYIGMANVYRNYLIENGTLDELQKGETESTLPLYIHAYGALNGEDTFLSIPITVEKPLTTFTDVMAMNEEFKENNITNVNYILEGFANGNMSKPYYPTYVKWGKTVGGKKGLNELLVYAEDNGIGIYPDFDFSTAYWVKTFSGFSYRKHAARAMSGRYTTKRDYDYVFQVIRKFGKGNVVSSGAYLELFEKFAKDYDKYSIGGISVLSLGTDLNSDFNEDYPITREDSKVNTQELLAKISEKYGNVIIEGGNAYTWAYATDIMNIPLGNSRYQLASATIPFIGMVLHGYMNYTGNVINTSGDIQYDVLKSLENGASLYFLLSKQNSNEFKNAMEMGLNENYSVNFDTWRDDVVAYYHQLNGAIGSLQTATITGHGFLTAYNANAETANYLFGQYNAAKNRYESLKAEYEAAIALSAEMIKQGKALEAKESFQKERDLLPRVNKALAQYEACVAFVERESVSDVVYVTYTDDNGNETTFYINYNSHDVAVEYDGGIYILKAESFVNVKDIVAEDLSALSSEVLTTALKPTAGLLKRYESAKEAYEKALAAYKAAKDTSGEGKAQINLNKAIESLNLAIEAIGNRKAENVLKMTSADGKTAVYFNYETVSVLVPVAVNAETGVTEYKTVASQSYVTYVAD